MAFLGYNVFYTQIFIFLVFLTNNKEKKVVFFMLFGHSEPNSGRQACKKIKKNGFELDLSKEVLFSQNGGGGRKVASGSSTTAGRTNNPGLGHMVSSTVNCPKIMKKQGVFTQFCHSEDLPALIELIFLKKKSLSTDLTICALLRPTRGGDPEN